MYLVNIGFDLLSEVFAIAIYLRTQTEYSFDHTQNKKYVWYLVTYKKMYIEGWETTYIMYSALCFSKSESGMISYSFLADFKPFS